MEAVHTELHHIEAILEQYYPDAMNFGQIFEPGKENFTLEEKHEIASGQRAGEAWMPETAKRNWISAMEYVVAGKTSKLRKGNYSASSSTWLLVQDEWPNSLRFYPEQVRAAGRDLLERISPLLAPPAFQAIFISSVNQLLCFEADQYSVEQVCNLRS
ncbi:MAG: hypothetical protein LH479_06265 [Polaromonas sp.]|nr:hypothetical protein [Polaromonas sp.]